MILKKRVWSALQEDVTFFIHDSFVDEVQSAIFAEDIEERIKSSRGVTRPHFQVVSECCAF